MLSTSSSAARANDTDGCRSSGSNTPKGLPQSARGTAAFSSNMPVTAFPSLPVNAAADASAESDHRKHAHFPAISPATISAFKFNHNAAPFCPKPAGESYEDDVKRANMNNTQALEGDWQASNVSKSQGEVLKKGGDNGKVLIPDDHTNTAPNHVLLAFMKAVASDFEDDECGEEGGRAGECGCEEEGDIYSRGTSTQAGYYDDEAEDQGFASEDLEEFDDLNAAAGQYDDAGMYAEEELTEEERAWLEEQCEARDNPEGFFW